jgi:methionine-rich copper-binding protein CopC
MSQGDAERKNKGIVRGEIKMEAATVQSQWMLRIRIPTLWLVLAILPATAWGREMHVVTSTPAAEAVMHGRNMQYLVRFDGPVDHVRSRLEIVHEGNLVASLYPRLNSAPDVLFASAPTPGPGKYALHWIVKSMGGEDTSEGMIPFSVAP